MRTGPDRGAVLLPTNLLLLTVLQVGAARLIITTLWVFALDKNVYKMKGMVHKLHIDFLLG